MKCTFAKVFAALLAVALLAPSIFADSAEWNLMPGSGDWNTAGNWTPAAVPNGAADTATFDLSNTTAVSISANTEVDGIVFNSGASAFTITSNPSFTLTLSGTGVTNNSGITQNFVTDVDGAGNHGNIHFTNSATAGSMTVYTNNGATVAAVPGITNFYDTSTADNATFINNGGTADGAGGGATQFIDTGTTAANGNFTNNGGTVDGSFGGSTNFLNGTAANGTFINNAGLVAGAGQGRTIFQNSATAADGMFTNNGASASGATGGSTEFLDTSTAANSTIISEGGTAAGAGGGLTLFSGNGANVFESSFAGNATLIANGGTGGGDGGSIRFIFYSSGETARVELFGNGNLDISFLFSGGTSIGSLEGDGNVFLGSQNLAIGTNNMDTTFSGVIQDGGVNPETGGTISKVGTGTLTLTNDSTYTGGTAIESGTLAIGSLNAMGTGDVTVNGGTLRTFNGPRPMAVGGNYVQNGGGTLQLQIGGLDSGSESDFLTVNGSATLGGTLSLVRINNFNPALGDRVNIIGDLAGHTGMFDTVTSTFAGMLRPVPHYDEALDIYIVFEIASFSSVGNLTPNQQSVANELDLVRNDPRASTLIDFLVIEPFANLPRDYDLIAPEELASIYEIGFSNAAIQTLNLQRRMDDIRAGSNGFSSAGLSMELINAYFRATGIRPDGELIADNTPSRYMQSRPDNPWGFFVTGTGQFINVGDHDLNAPGYDITTGGFTLGVDYRVCPTFAIGIDGGYAHSWADLVDDGRVTVDGGKVGVYAAWFPAELYITGAFNAGWNNYDTRRAALLGDANGSTNGYELNGFLSAGYDWKMRSWTFGPVGTIQYTFVSFDGFTEDGSLAPLHFPEQDQDSIRSTVGGRLAYDWRCGNMIVRPEVRASWQHEYADRAYAVDSQFASGAGDVFTVWGPRIGRDAAAVSGGLAVQWSERVSTYVSYDGVLGRSNYNSHNASGGIRISF